MVQFLGPRNSVRSKIQIQIQVQGLDKRYSLRFASKAQIHGSVSTSKVQVQVQDVVEGPDLDHDKVEVQV